MKIFIVGSVTQNDVIREFAFFIKQMEPEWGIVFVQKSDASIDDFLQNVFEQINNADAVFVMQKENGQVAYSTQRAIHYAFEHSKSILYFNPLSYKDQFLNLWSHW